MTRLACLVVVLLGAAGPARAEQRFALVIGSNPGWSQDRPLRFAEHDAERVRDVLVSLGGVAADHVQLLRDPDTAELRAAFGRLGEAVRAITTEDTLVFVYYSGHADDRHLHLRGDPPIAHRELHDLMRALPATVRLGVIDACKSGAVTRKGGVVAAEFDLDVATPKLAGMVVLTSSGADELSQESRALAGSVFTHHLVSGLRGAADANGDQVVTLAEAYSHAYELTRADTAPTGAPQRPAFSYELRGQGELVVTRLATALHVQLRAPRGPPQRYLILDAHEWRLIAEVRSEPDRDVVVSLAPGSYRIKHVRSDRIGVASVAVVPGSRVELDRVPYEDAPLAVGILKGDPGDLSPAEHHEWARSRAFGTLAEGNATAALNMFDRLLHDVPGDAIAWRGRGRALVRLAESYQRVGDQPNELRALLEALRSDPSLVNDPAFQGRYLALTAAERAVQAEAARKKLAIEANPRGARRWGLGFDFVSARGPLALNATIVHGDGAWFTTLSFDVIEVGLDAALLWLPLRSRWSPYLGLGSHATVRAFGVEVHDVSPDDTPAVRDDRESIGRVFQYHARIEGGAQYVGPSGFTADLGVCALAYRGADGKADVTGFPVLHLGWLF